MTNITHTATPYKQGYNDTQVIYSDAKKVFVMDCSNKDWKANAAFIVKAVNSHDELVVALAMLVDGLTRKDEYAGYSIADGLDKAKQALKNAGK